jgi:hypothetical protein
MVVTMHCFANRSASMPRLDMEPPDPDELGVLPPLAGVGVARNRQFTIYSSDRTSNTLSSSGVKFDLSCSKKPEHFYFKREISTNTLGYHYWYIMDND